jgi:basic amino acid/polyamine antiporter, APA family
MAAEAPKLKREVGMLGLTSITVGGIIGSGIFALAATMGSTAGPAAIVALVLLGIVVILLALPYAELSAAFPITGGPYSLPRRAMGDFGGFLIGWGYFLYAFIGTAAIIDVFVEYLGTYVGGLTFTNAAGILSISLVGVAVALVVLVAYTLLNIAGVKWGTAFAIVTTFSKLIPLILFGLVGLLFLRVGNFTSFGFSPFGWTGVAFAMSLGFFAFTGFEAASIPAEEVKDPKRTLPRATILSVGIVTSIYALVAVAFLGGIRWFAVGVAPGDWGGTGSLLLNNVADGWGLAILGTVVVVGAIISTLGAGGDWVLLQGRMPYAMARDSLFFKSMARIHPRFGTPWVALVFASALTGVILVALPSFPEVALVASITTLLPYGAAALSLLILRRTAPNTDRPYRLPFATVLTPVAFVFATILIYWASWPWTLVGVFLMLIGVPLYFLFTSPELRTLKSGLTVGGIVIVLLVVSLLLIYVAPPGGTLLGVAASPLLGTVLLFVGLPVYFLTFLLRRSAWRESKSILWIVAYVAGIGIISYLGDPFFVFDNFLTPPSYPITLAPVGLLNVPWDLVVLAAFGLAMFVWGYISSVRFAGATAVPVVGPEASAANVTRASP